VTHAGGAVDARLGRHADDAASLFALDPAARGGPRADERTLEIDRDDGGEAVRAELLGAGIEARAVVVDQDVDAAERGIGVIEHGLHLGRITHVAG